MKLTVQKIGDDLAVILPEEVAQALALGEGDAIEVEKAGAPGAAPSMTQDELLARARDIAARYPETLSELAK